MEYVKPGLAEVNEAFRKIEDKRRRSRLQKAVTNRRFSIIASNCWGGEVYRDLGIPYLTPFVGLYLHFPCFITFLENFEAAIRAPLEFVHESRYKGKMSYPVGLIMGTCEIHFMHYRSQEEAKDKWNRRCARVVDELDDCFFVHMHLGIYSSELSRFTRLPFRNKLLLVDQPQPHVPEAVCVPPPAGAIGPDDGPTLYRRCHRYFDVARWLNKEPIAPLS